MSANDDLLRFVLQHGAFVSEALWRFAEYESSSSDAERARNVAKDLDHLWRVNRQDWTHETHSGDCMSDDAEGRRWNMTAETVAANHHLHMGHVLRVNAALRGQR